jgi:hypothetical protein
MRGNDEVIADAYMGGVDGLQAAINGAIPGERFDPFGNEDFYNP